jgi:mannonate dehydratase
MAQYSRRSFIKKNIAVASASSVFSILPGQSMAFSRKGKLQLALHLNLRNPERLKICQQMGVTHAITGAPFRDIGKDQYTAAAKKLKEDFEAAGFTIAGIEGHPVRFEKIKLGLDGRDEEIANTNAAIEALSKAGIDML